MKMRDFCKQKIGEKTRKNPKIFAWDFMLYIESRSLRSP